MLRFVNVLAILVVIACSAAYAEETAGRRPADAGELEGWLRNMAWHRYSLGEMSDALDMREAEVATALEKAKIDLADPPHPSKPGELTLLPYPGGRHPRIGFLDGATGPQRETKLSVFTPWDERSYVVVDLPEALWSNLGLTYLAHTHVETIWEKQHIELPKQEWQRAADGSLTLERKLPNGIVYRAAAKQAGKAIAMELTLTNGTTETLSDLRVQNCVMLKGARGFEQQTNDNKRFEQPFVAVRNAAGDRWIITAWEQCQRAWGNAPCPCLHSDPKFSDLAPGASQTLHGWLWFFEGTAIDDELSRLAVAHKLPLSAIATHKR